MREILFRGKELDSGNWVEGDLIHNDNGYYPVTFIGGVSVSRNEHTHKYADTYCLDGYYLPVVDPETVGQYTGLTDKNGKRIFEGDIVSEIFSYPKTYAVKFDEGRGGWYPFACGDGCGCCETDTISPSFIEVIGNIHDNPELIAEVEG